MRLFFYRYRCGLSLLFLIVIVFALTLFFFSYQIVTVDSGDVQADALVILGGGSKQRAERAAELYREGKAPRIVVSGITDTEANAQLLVKNGVPATVITLESNSHSTLENARFSVLLLRRLGAHRVIIVTSWYHSRRALACFEHFAPEITFYSRPSYESYHRGDWNHESIPEHLRIEYLKTFGYWAWYGVCPF
jgi:uncharacterized SAM-binding protein YcdF (DUF218 family)